MFSETCSDLIPKEIEEVVRDAFHSTELCMVQVWVPCLQSDENQIQHFFPKECLYRHELFIKGTSRTYRCDKNHSLRDQGILGKAFATNQPWFSTDVSSNPDTDCRDPHIKSFSVHSAISIPFLVNNDCGIPTCGIPDKYVFEFFLPNYFEDFEKHKQCIDKLISTLQPNVKKIKEQEQLPNLFATKRNNFPPFQLVLQPIHVVGQSGASDSLFPIENPREASGERFLPEPRIEPGQGRFLSMARKETNEERHSTGETNFNVPSTSLELTAKSSTVSFPHIYNSSQKQAHSINSERDLQDFIQEFGDGQFEKENLGETLDGRWLPEPSYQNAKSLETTPRTEPSEVFGDNISQGICLSLAVTGTSEESHVNIVPGTSLNGAAKSTRGKTTGSAWNKRDWAWKYCSPIEGNSNGVICSFCGLEIKGGGITRFKSHLSNSDPSKNVNKCENVPSDVKVETEKRLKRA